MNRTFAFRLASRSPTCCNCLESISWLVEAHEYRAGALNTSNKQDPSKSFSSLHRHLPRRSRTRGTTNTSRLQLIGSLWPCATSWMMRGCGLHLSSGRRCCAITMDEVERTASKYAGPGVRPLCIRLYQYPRV